MVAFECRSCRAKYQALLEREGPSIPLELTMVMGKRKYEWEFRCFLCCEEKADK